MDWFKQKKHAKKNNKKKANIGRQRRVYSVHTCVQILLKIQTGKLIQFGLAKMRPDNVPSLDKRCKNLSRNFNNWPTNSYTNLPNMDKLNKLPKFGSPNKWTNPDEMKHSPTQLIKKLDARKQGWM